MAVPVFLNFPQSGPLDTTNPISDRPVGTLVEAANLASRWIGPRLGALSIAQARNTSVSAAAPRPVDDYYRFTGAADERLFRNMVLQQQYLLPRSWTVDIVFAPEIMVGNSLVSIFSWTSPSGDNDIIAKYHTQGSGTPRVMQIEVNTQGGASGENVMLGTQPIIPGSVGAESQNHIRIIRLRERLGFFVNGVLDQEIAIVDNYHGGGSAVWQIAGGLGVPRFTGIVHRVIVRQGGILSGVEGYSDYMFPMNDDIRLCVYGGRQIKESVAGTPVYHTRDYSRFGSDGKIDGTPDIIPALAEPPLRQAVQLITTFTDQRARRWNIYMVGGTLFWESAA